jgi:hypothetical protein
MNDPLLQAQMRQQAASQQQQQQYQAMLNQMVFGVAKEIYVPMVLSYLDKLKDLNYGNSPEVDIELDLAHLKQIAQQSKELALLLPEAFGMLEVREARQE